MGRKANPGSGAFERNEQVCLEDFQDDELLWLPTLAGTKSNTVFIVKGPHYGKLAIFPTGRESDADPYLLRFITTGDPWPACNPFSRPDLILKMAVEDRGLGHAN